MVEIITLEAELASMFEFYDINILKAIAFFINLYIYKCK